MLSIYFSSLYFFRNLFNSSYVIFNVYDVIGNN